LVHDRRGGIERRTAFQSVQAMAGEASMAAKSAAAIPVRFMIVSSPYF
jgi:hypothetical protein